MSIKIREAYEIKKGNDPWKTIINIKRELVARTKLDLLDMYQLDIADTSLSDVTDLMSASQRMKSRWKNNPESLYDYTSCLTIRKIGRRYLIIPYLRTIRAARYLSRCTKLSDFHYQNQSDQPANIDSKTWSNRARVWSKVIHEPEWSDFITVDILTLDNFYKLDPAWDLKIVKVFLQK